MMLPQEMRRQLWECLTDRSREGRSDDSRVRLSDPVDDFLGQLSSRSIGRDGRSCPSWMLRAVCSSLRSRRCRFEGQLCPWITPDDGGPLTTTSGAIPGIMTATMCSLGR